MSPITVREAHAADVPALAQLHVVTFIETHHAASPPTYELRAREWREAFEQADGSWCCYLAETADGELVGFARGTPHDGSLPGYAGELNKLYVLRRYHRQALGRGLVGQVARRFLQAGIESMLLFGAADSPSNGFYEHLGAERLLSPEGAFHGGYGWRGLRALAEACGAM